MKKLVFIFLGLLLFTLSSFRDDDWVVFISHDETFKLQFPGMPEISKNVISTGMIPIKSKLIKYEVGKFKDDNISYSLIYSDYADTFINSDFKLRITDTFLKRVIFDTKEELGGNLISIANDDFNEYPGRHIHYTFANGKRVLNMKIFLVKNRLYLMKIVCETLNDNNPSMQRFFDSFELLDIPKTKGKEDKKSESKKSIKTKK